MGDLPRLRLALVTNILPPYRVLLFNKLAKQRGVELKVFLCTETEPDRHWKWPSDIRFDYEIGSTWKFSPRSTATIYLNPGLIRRLKQFHPDVVVCGSIGLVALMSWIGSKICGARHILWAEGMTCADGWIGHVMKPVRAFLVRTADACIASSQSAAALFEFYGASKKRITISLITLDIAGFSQQVSEYRTEIELLRNKLNLSGQTILYVGQLEPYKGVDLLLAAFERLLEDLPSTQLVVVGTGSELENLKAQAVSNCRNRVHFVGFKQPNELPAYYAIADLFTLFSRHEPFGLVVTEAVAAGLPVICSKYAGAAYDLVDDGQNGFVIDPEDLETNARLMSQILYDDSLRERMEQRSLEISKKCGLEISAKAMMDAVNVAFAQENNRQKF